MLTKHLNHDDLYRELERDGLADDRPGLALSVLRGNTVYITRDAAGVETELSLKGAVVPRATPTASAEISDAEVERRLDAILERRTVPTASRAAPAVVAAPARQNQGSVDGPDASEALVKAIRRGASASGARPNVTSTVDASSDLWALVKRGAESLDRNAREPTRNPFDDGPEAA
jgi:hypothetical protein